MNIEELLNLLEPMICNKARHASTPGHDYVPGMEWEDIAQELRILVWRYHERFVNGKSSPKTFGNTVFRNRIIDLKRTNKRHDYSGIDNEIVSRSATFIESIDTDTIKRLLLIEEKPYLRIIGAISENQFIFRIIDKFDEYLLDHKVLLERYERTKC